MCLLLCSIQFPSYLQACLKQVGPVTNAYVHLLLCNSHPDLCKYFESTLAILQRKKCLCTIAFCSLWTAMDCEPPQKRPRGGQRQRLKQLEAPTSPSSSHLAELLTHKWAWGELSLQEVQRIASAANNDFEGQSCKAPKELELLANLGSKGRFPNNMHSELLKHASKPCKFSAPALFCCPLSSLGINKSSAFICHMWSSVTFTISTGLPLTRT